MNKAEIKKKWSKKHYERKQMLLSYLTSPQAATDTAVDLDMSLQVVLRYLRELGASGHVEKTGWREDIKFKATGKLLDDESAKIPTNKYNTGFTFLGVRF